MHDISMHRLKQWSSSQTLLIRCTRNCVPFFVRELTFHPVGISSTSPFFISSHAYGALWWVTSPYYWDWRNVSLSTANNHLPLSSSTTGSIRRFFWASAFTIERLDPVVIRLQKHVRIGIALRKIPVRHTPFLKPIEIVGVDVFQQLWINDGTICFETLVHD